MRVLITGATGLIGRHLLSALRKENQSFKILAPSRNIEAASQLFGDIDNVSIVAADDWSAIRRFNPEVTIHLAGLCSSKDDIKSLDELVESNLLYGIHLLHCLKDCSSLRLFVNTGTCTEYRKGTQKVDDAYLYSATKTAFRSMLAYYADIGAFKFITAVPYSVYGGKSDKVKRIFDYMIDALDSLQPVSMTSGMQVLDFIHVEDVASFYLTVLTDVNRFSDLQQGYEFYLGTGRGHTLREVAQIIESATGKVLNIAWGTIPHRMRDTMHAVAPVAANNGMWSSHITLEEGIARYLTEREI